MSQLSHTIVAQHDVRSRLARLVAEDRVPHAMLISGPEGCGKLAIALELARALLCHHPVDGHACDECPACKMSDKWVHPDLHFVFPIIKPAGSSAEVTSDYYLSQWRELLRRTPYFDRQDWLTEMGVGNQQSQIPVAESDSILRKLSLTASQGGAKVMLVWLPEQMNLQTANKLLKVLEEPPRGTYFLLVSEQPDALLPTILSRTQLTRIPPLRADEIARALVEVQGLQGEDARQVARQSGGNYIAALRQITVNADAGLFFDMFVLLMRLSYMRDIKGIRSWADDVAEWGRERQKNFLTYALHMVRENFVYNFRLPELNYMNRQEADFAVRFARFINEGNVIPMADTIEQAMRDVGQNVNPRMVFFDFGLQMIVLLVQR